MSRSTTNPLHDAGRRAGGEVVSPTVVAMPIEGHDTALVMALWQYHPGAPAALYDRYAVHVRRVLGRVLGNDTEIPDLLQEVFGHALRKIHSLENPERLRAWLTTIATFVARGCIRRRKRQRWLTFWAPEELPEISVDAPEQDATRVTQHTYAVLQRLPADERIVFALRFIDGMELTELAEACEISLATVKRRLARARERFETLARRDPVLAEWLRDRGES